MYSVYGTDKDSIGMMIAGEFIKNTGYPITGGYSAMGFVKDNKLIGQAIFDNYTGANIDIHLYAPGCFNRQIIKSVYQYVFNFKKVERVSAKPFHTNQKLLQLLPRLGFVYEFTQERYFKEDSGDIFDAVNFKLTRNNVPDWVKLNA